ncbi:MAG: MlaC/ttg2D family ABC transporter substrate-binding protein [Candidatus Binatia bacterium]
MTVNLRLTGLAIGLALTLAAAAAVSAEQTASQVVDRLSGQVLTILRDQALSSDQKRTRIEAIAYEAMDFDTLSKLVLARNWSKFSPTQQQEFVAEFKRHLTVTYGRNVDSFQNEEVQILGERPEARGDVTVQTKLLRGGASEDVLLDYRLRQKDGQWMIIDVIVEGVSLVSNFRSQFQDIVAKGGPDKLLALLREKNASGEPLQVATPEDH